MNNYLSLQAANENSNPLKSIARYWLLDQRVNNLVQIYDTLTERATILPALDIAKNREMIRNFYPEEAFMIGVIAGQATA